MALVELLNRSFVHSISNYELISLKFKCKADRSTTDRFQQIEILGIKELLLYKLQIEIIHRMPKQNILIFNER